jgi:hypothetical protein
MPNSTLRYRFEFRVHDWAERLSVGLCGARVGFFVGLRADGTVRRLYFRPRGESVAGESKTALAEAHPRWFLYQPYEDEGSAYIEWLGLDQPTVERWLGRPLERADFLDVRSAGHHEGWPEAWRVIVA